MHVGCQTRCVGKPPTKNAAAKIFGPLPLAHLLAHHSEHLGCQTPIRNLIYMTGFIYPLHSDLAFAKARYVMCIYLNIYIYVYRIPIYFLISFVVSTQEDKTRQNPRIQVAK